MFSLVYVTHWYLKRIQYTPLIKLNFDSYKKKKKKKIKTLTTYYYRTFYTFKLKAFIKVLNHKFTQEPLKTKTIKYTLGSSYFRYNVIKTVYTLQYMHFDNIVLVLITTTQ